MMTHISNITLIFSISASDLTILNVSIKVMCIYWNVYRNSGYEHNHGLGDNHNKAVLLGIVDFHLFEKSKG